MKLKSPWAVAHSRLVRWSLFSLVLSYALFQHAQGAEDRLLLGLSDLPVFAGDQFIGVSVSESRQVQVPNIPPSGTKSLLFSTQGEVGQCEENSLPDLGEGTAPHDFDGVLTVTNLAAPIERPLDVLTDQHDTGLEPLEDAQSLGITGNPHPTDHGNEPTEYGQEKRVTHCGIGSWCFVVSGIAALVSLYLLASFWSWFRCYLNDRKIDRKYGKGMRSSISPTNV